MSTKMSNAPVYFALAQVVFNPVAAMHKYVDEIQDQFRREGYTLFEANQVAHVQFSAVSAVDMGQPKFETITNWGFSKAGKEIGFILNNNSLTLQTTFYESREEFIPELLNGIAIVHKVVGLDHISRVGLRYLNAVIPKKDESLDLYLDPGLHGIQLDFNRRYSLSEIVFNSKCGPLIEQGTLVIKVYSAYSLLGFPPDLSLNGLVANPKFKTEEALIHSIIDMDHFTDGKVDLDLEKLQDQFFSQHDAIRDAFRTTATQHALSVWE